MSSFNLADSQLTLLHLDARRGALRLSFAYVAVCDAGSDEQRGFADVTIDAEQVEFLTIFQMRSPESVDHAYFRRGGLLIGLNDLLREAGASVEDSEIVLSPFAEVAFRARAVTAVPGPVIERGYDRRSDPRPAASGPSSDGARVPNLGGQPAELVSLSVATEHEEVTIVLTEPTAPGSGLTRFVELRGVGLDLLTCHRLGPPFRVSDVSLYHDGRRILLTDAAMGEIESPTVYLELFARAMIEWKPRRMSVRVLTERPSTTADAGAE